MPRIDDAARDAGLIERILAYCDEIETTHGEFGRSRARFTSRKTYQNAVAMCILQIGELSKRLSERFVLDHPDIPWKAIARTRDAFAHHYGHADLDMLWNTATDSIDALRGFCARYLGIDKTQNP